MHGYIQANTNGRLHDAREPSISPLNRSFLYGDAIYEVWRSYDGVLFAFEEHWHRLNRSARAIHMEIGLSREQLIEEILRTAEAFRAHTGYQKSLYIRLQLTRGAGPIGLDLTLPDAPEWVIYVQALRPTKPRAGRSGFHLHIARKLIRNPPESLNPAWKTGNYLNNALCLREAREAGADEVLILNQHGAITEAAVCNVFFLKGDSLVTPPLDAGILEGVTRGLIIEKIAPEVDLRVLEKPIRPEEIGEFSECFLSSSTRDIEPVERVDGFAYQVGPETNTARLKQAFACYASKYAEAHPQWRV